MKLTSPAFNHDSSIPSKYGYKFENMSPPLKIENIPKNTKSLVLIMDDPDAMEVVGKVWIHWLIWNISPDIQIINENFIPENSKEGLNDFGEIGYGGPAPPDKEHKYFFKLYALNRIPDLKEGSSKIELENEISENIIEESVLTGRFSP